MKLPSLLILLAPALLPAVLQAQQVRETPATLGLVEGGNPQGYIQGSNDQGIIFSTQPGATGQLVPYNRIRGEGIEKLIRLEERTEVLGTPRGLFSAGNYAEAAEAFGKVARDYAIVINAPQNFASEALFYQLESLKRAGLYQAMAPIVKLPVANTINTKLDDAYKRPFEFHKLWALFGENDMAGLKAALEVYQDPQTGSAKLLKSPNFKKLPTEELAQLAFLRGKIYDAEGNKESALEDYYRCFTLAYGNDVLLSKLAMGAAMLIQQQDPRLAKENPQAIAQMQSIAYFFSRRFGKDSMPPAFQQYAVKPELPKPAAAEEAPAEKPAEDGAAKPADAPAPADAPDAAKPADGAKPE